MMATPERIEQYFRENPERRPVLFGGAPAVNVTPDEPAPSCHVEPVVCEPNAEPGPARAKFFQGVRAFICRG